MSLGICLKRKRIATSFKSGWLDEVIETESTLSECNDWLFAKYSHKMMTVVSFVWFAVRRKLLEIFQLEDHYRLWKLDILKRHFSTSIVLYLSISIALLTAWVFQKRSRPQQLTLCRSLHAEALQATASEGLAQGPYVASRAGFEHTTLRFKGIDSTNVPPRPTWVYPGLGVAPSECKHYSRQQIVCNLHVGPYLWSSEGKQHRSLSNWKQHSL